MTSKNPTPAFNEMNIHDHLSMANRHIEAALLISETEVNTLKEVDESHFEPLLNAAELQELASIRIINATNAMLHELSPENFAAFNALSKPARDEWAMLIVNGLAAKHAAAKFVIRDLLV